MNADQDSTDSSEKQETGNRGMTGLAFDFYVTNFTQLFLLVLQVFFLAYLAEEIFESDLILSLIYGAILAPLSVAVHRAIVLQEPLDASQYLPSFRHGRVWKFFGYGVLFALFGFLIVTLFSIIAGAGLFMGAMSDGSGSQFGVAILIGIAIAVFLLLRFAFVWPAIATDQFQSLGDSARQMRGMTWKVLGALIMVALPLIVVGLLAELIRFLSPVSDVANFLWLPMGPAVLSFAYVSATADWTVPAAQVLPTFRVGSGSSPVRSTGWTNWYFLVFKRYADFSGMARRREYWLFAIFNSIAIFVLIVLDVVLGLVSRSYGVGLLSSLYLLAILVPMLSVYVRRLHDVGRSGWLVFLAVVGGWGGHFAVRRWISGNCNDWNWNCYSVDSVPSLLFNCWTWNNIDRTGGILALVIAVLVFQVWVFAHTFMDSKPGDNQYGPNPKGVTEAPPPKKKKEVPAAISPAERVARLAREDPTAGE